MILKENIADLATGHLKNTPVFVTAVKIGPGNNIQVFIDGDQGVTIDDCVALSRAIESGLDREREDFSLEVSSYGATSPLLMPRQYPRHKGRTLEVKLVNGHKAEGQLVLCNNENITLEYTVRENKPIGKGKVDVVKQLNVAFSEIKEARIKLKY